MKELLTVLNLKYVRRGPLTTVLGIVILVAALASVFIVPGMSWYEAGVGMLIGIVLALVKDPGKRPPNPPGGSVTIALVLLLMLSSCYTRKACLDKVCPTTESHRVDSIYTERTVEYRDSIITLPGDTATYIVQEPCDSLGILRDFEATILGELNQAMAVVRGRDNTLTVDCLCAEQKAEIRRLTTQINTLRSQKQTHRQVIERKYIPWYARWKTIAVGGVALYLAGSLKLHQAVLKGLSKMV